MVENRTAYQVAAHPDMIQAFQAADTGSSRASASKSLNDAIINESVHKGGRGIDKSAAKAAAEVRKKAAAKGLLTRPNGALDQAGSPLTQLLNIITSTPDATKETIEEGKQVANGHTSNGVPEPEVGDKSEPVEHDQAPVGLGSNS